MCMEHKDIESWGCDVGVFIMVFSWIYLFLYWRLFYLNKVIPTPASMVLPSSSSGLLAFPSGERSFNLKSSLM